LAFISPQIPFKQLALIKFARCKQYAIDTMIHCHQYTIATGGAQELLFLTRANSRKWLR